MSEDALITPTADLAAAHVGRAGVRRACARLRELLSASSRGTADAGGPGPADAVAVALADLIRQWDNHIARTEGPDGLLEQILTDCPRLAPMVGRLGREHPAIADRLRAAPQLRREGDPDLPAEVADLPTTLTAIERHHRDGGELIHRAYNVDIGLGE
jgi:hypothetical protein